MASKDQANQGKRKGLPNRAARAHRSHVRRADSAARRQKRREERRFEQHGRELDNKRLHEAGVPTAWEVACERRAERRSKDPFIIRRRRLFLAEALKMPTDAGHRP